MTTGDDTATTWRQLAEELTPQQIDSLERFEDQLPAEVLLGFAREHVEERLADMAFCDVPAPAGAEVGDWECNTLDDGDTSSGWSRSLHWGAFGPVDVGGRQQDDGTYTRAAIVYVEAGTELDAAGARRLAAELLEAAELLGDGAL
jgi:hypothetical protein